MKIKTVKIRNFRGYGENKNVNDKFYVFDNLNEFDIIIFNGLNGNGKTSFYEAIEWCLTGNVARLNNILKGVHKGILKKSNHLIFNDSNGKCRNEATVILEFDNGYILERKTNSKIIPVKDKTDNQLDYIDKLKLTIDNNIFEDEDAKTKLIKYITEREIDLIGVYKSIALGQETLSYFLREYNHTSRDDLLMQLFNLDEFYEIKNLSSSNNFTQLSGLNSNINAKKEEIQDLKEYINSIFESTGYTIDEYKNLSDMDYQSLKQKFKTEITYTIKDSNIEGRLSRITYLKDKCEELGKKLSFANIKNEDLKLLLYIQVFKDIENKIKSINTIKLLNKEKLQETKTSCEKKINKYIKNIDKAKEFRKDLNRRKSNIKNISIEELKIDDVKSPTLIIKRELEYFDSSNVIDSGIEFSEIEKNIKEISKTYNDINLRLDVMNKEIKQLTTISSEYNDALESIKSYINKNEVDCCPVCKSENILDENNILGTEASIKDKILNVIDNTISKNEVIIEKKLNEKQKLIKEANYTELLFKNKVIEPLKLYQLCIECLIDKKIERFNSFIKKSLAYIDKNKIVIEESQSNISRVKSLEDELESLLNKYKTLDQFKEILENYRYFILNTLKCKYQLYINREIDVKEQELRNSYALYNQKLIQCIKENKYKILRYKELIKYINEYIKKYDLLDSDIEKIKKYDAYSKKESRYKTLEVEVENYRKDRQKIYEYFNNKSNELLETKIAKYSDLGNYIYKSISPHPFFNQFEFNKMRGGREVTLLGNENINLSHIFSNAQVNILALSIFLGIGLIDNKIKIKQLFIDDPIQSMDDLNILAFIDILRTIVLSKKINKSLIISTHDDNFASLLKIKLRNIRYKEIKFIYYGDEGPIVKQDINIIN